MVAGVQSVAPDVSADAILRINLVTEIGDIHRAVKKEARPDVARWTAEQLRDYHLRNSHCSAIFKLTANLSDVFSSHGPLHTVILLSYLLISLFSHRGALAVTWTSYTSMLRVFKTYDLNYAPVSRVRFSGYPATIPGFFVAVVFQYFPLDFAYRWLLLSCFFLSVFLSSSSSSFFFFSFLMDGRH